MTTLEYLSLWWLPSRERLGPASKSEIRRWLDAKALEINGERYGLEDMPPFIFSAVLLPNGKNRTTLR